MNYLPDEWRRLHASLAHCGKSGHFQIRNVRDAGAKNAIKKNKKIETKNQPRDMFF